MRISIIDSEYSCRTILRDTRLFGARVCAACVRQCASVVRTLFRGIPVYKIARGCDTSVCARRACALVCASVDDRLVARAPASTLAAPPVHSASGARDVRTC